MNVLITGATGFIGRSVCAALAASGHTVVRAVRTPMLPSDIAVDFERDTHADVWLPRLKGIDAVINAVGLLGGSEQRMMAVHRDAPAALANACATAGIGKFVQLSALGVDSGLSTRYFRSKLAGEQAVRAALPSAHIVRPSIVFGYGGDSSEMFMQLTRLPVLMLPQQGKMLVQPVHVDDVCGAVVKLLDLETPQTLAALGQAPTTMGQYLASLAQQLGRRAPLILAMPMFLARSSAALMQYFPQHVWTPETLAMLLAGSPGSASQLTALLGRPPRAVERFIERSL